LIQQKNMALEVGHRSCAGLLCFYKDVGTAYEVGEVLDWIAVHSKFLAGGALELVL